MQLSRILNKKRALSMLSFIHHLKPTAHPNNPPPARLWQLSMVAATFPASA
jgi:hypothetical protein